MADEQLPARILYEQTNYGQQCKEEKMVEWFGGQTLVHNVKDSKTYSSKGY